VTEHTPYFDFENLPTPSEGFLVTLFITVRSVARSRAFYSEVLGGQVVLEENPCMVKLANSWVIMNPGGGPTPDKPDISVVNYEFDNTVSTFMNLRVADIQGVGDRSSFPPIASVGTLIAPISSLISVRRKTARATSNIPSA